MSYIGQGLPADTFQGFTTDKFTGDGTANKTFTQTKEPFSEDTILVTIDGVIQEPTDDFTVSGTTLTLVGTAANNSEINVTHMGGPLPIGGASELDLNGASDKLILDADADTTISADTDDQIDFKVGGVDEMTLSSTGLVINEGSNDRDVRIESNGNTSMLHVDGGNDRVLVGSSTGASDFHVKVATNGTNAIIENTSHNTILQILCANNTKNSVLEFGDADDDDIASIDYDHNDNTLRFTTNTTEHAKVLSSGHWKFTSTGSYAYTNAFHSFLQDQDSQQVLYLTHTDADNPYGVQVNFSGGAPDNNTEWFFIATDATAARWIVRADGDVDNHDNSYGSLSDERIKQDIVDANSQWDDIKALKIRNFKKKDDVRQYGENAWKQIGVIAQELETAGMDKLINENNPTAGDIRSSSEFGTLYTADDSETQGDNPTAQVGDVKEIKTKVKSVKYSILYMKAIKALQEAMAKIETLETKVKALEDA